MIDFQGVGHAALDGKQGSWPYPILSSNPCQTAPLRFHFSGLPSLLHFARLRIRFDWFTPNVILFEKGVCTNPVTRHHFTYLELWVLRHHTTVLHYESINIPSDPINIDVDNISTYIIVLRTINIQHYHIH